MDKLVMAALASVVPWAAFFVPIYFYPMALMGYLLPIIVLGFLILGLLSKKTYFDKLNGFISVFWLISGIAAVINWIMDSTSSYLETGQVGILILGAIASIHLCLRSQEFKIQYSEKVNVPFLLPKVFSYYWKILLGIIIVVLVRDLFAMGLFD
jgi:hypothetical protein